MATPKFDVMHLMFRRHPQVSDLRNPTTGAEITTASVDGNWSVAEVSDLLVRGINRLLAEAYTALLGKHGDSERASDDMHQMFSEYIQRGNLTGIAVGRSAQELEGTLPADYLAAIAASVYPSGQVINGVAAARRVRFVSPRYIESAMTGLYPECTTLLGQFRDGKLCVLDAQIRGGANFAGLVDHVTLEYVALQPSITQGGSTDVKLRETWYQNAVNQAVALIPQLQ